MTALSRAASFPAPVPALPPWVEALLRHSPERIYVKDRHGRFLTATDSTCRHHGLSHAEDIVGKSDVDFFTLAQAEAFARDEAKVFAGEPLIDWLHQENWPDGRITWAVTSKYPVREASGTIIAVLGITRDVTAEKQAEKALEEAEKQLHLAYHQSGMAQVAADVLHNVGNVLNSVGVAVSCVREITGAFRLDSIGKLAARLAQYEQPAAIPASDWPKFIELLQRVSEHQAECRSRLLLEVDALDHHISHIKEVITVQQSYATILGATEPIDAGAAFDDALRMTEPSLKRHQIVIERDYEPGLVLCVERGKILQVLVNLLRNAKEAIDSHHGDERRIRIRTSADGANVLLEVTDTGCGIAPANLERVFSHGFTTKSSGHGLGLHFCANVIASMGGTVQARSPGVNQGATFSVRLPAAHPGTAGPRAV